MAHKIKFGDILLFLEDKLHKVPKDNTASFKKRAYANVIAKIQQSYSIDEIATESKINNLPLTQNMKYKLYGWLAPNKRNTQKLLKLKTKGPSPSQNVKIDVHHKLKKELTSIMGIGSVNADQLIKEGVKSVDDLKKLKWWSKLPESAQIFLKYNPTRKIPHEHMIYLQPLICGFKYAPVIMVGSFRRETSFSRDFDVMIVSDSPAALMDYEYYLSKIFGKTYRYSSGEDRVSFLIEIPKKLLKTEADMVYKFDVFRTPKSNQFSMLLYSTGSKLFNIRMRAKAKRMGYLLNQDGLFHLESGKKVNIRSEKGFFDVLDMTYVEPKDRN